MKTIRTLMLCIAASLLLGACSKSAQTSPLEAQSQQIEAQLAPLVQNSPMFLHSIGVDYADATLTVAIDFADAAVDVNDYSDALVQFVLAQYLKSHPGADLDLVLNTLSKEKGKMVIKLSDTHGNAKNYDIPAARLIKLFQLKPMELNFSDVRSNVFEILRKQCPGYQKQYNAAECEFDYVGGFAQYTLTFERATAFANLNQASLTGRYLKELKPKYENYGDCRDMVEGLLKSLNIDGYRFVYQEKDGKKLSAGIPWRTIN